MNHELENKLIIAETEYHKNGYAKIAEVFTEFEMKVLSSAAKHALFKAREKHPDRIQWKNDHPALLFWPQDLSDPLRYFSHSDSMRQIVSRFLGSEVRQLNSQIYFRESGDGDEFAWHQDICFRTPSFDFEDIENKYLQTIIVVDKIDTNAAIEFIPGSHKWGDLKLVPRDNSEKGLRSFIRGEWSGEKLRAEPGDVIIWSSMVVHGSEQNESGRSRMTYMNGFAATNAIKESAITRFPKYEVE